MKRYSIFYIEDDENIASSVKDFLETEGFNVQTFKGDEQLDLELAEKKPDLLLLDWNLPLRSGVSICRHIRETDSSLPIIMLTVRDNPDDIVEGLQSGADDYITKPLTLKVLLSRIQALLRRTLPDVEALSFGDITISENTGRVFVKNQEISLTPIEYRLLTLFARNRGRIVTRDIIRDVIWEMSSDTISDNTITVAIRRLRSKLGSENYIKTIRSFGYRLEDPR